MRRALTGFALAAASAVAALAVLEAGMRVFSPQHLQRSEGLFVSDPDMAFRMAPNFSGREVGRGIDAAIRTNARGLRDRDFAYEKPEGVRRILVLGDSWTYGSGVEGEAAYPKALERLLRSRFPGSAFEVINAGVSAYGTVNELAYFKKEGRKYSPDLVILAFFPGNDLNDNTNPDRVRVNAHGELVPNGSRPRPLDGIKRFVRTRSHLYRLAGDRYHARSAVRGSLSRLNWGVFEDEEAPEVAAAWETAERLLAELHGAVREAGARLFVVGVPRLYQVSPARWKEFVAYYGLDEVRLDPAKPNRRLAAFCRARGIPFLDLAPGIAAAGDPEPLYRGHWTAAGNEAAAMLILQALERGGML